MEFYILNVSIKKSFHQDRKNYLTRVFSEILYFNDSKFKISELLVSLELASALNSFLNENNVNEIELPLLLTYCLLGTTMLR